MDGWERQLGLTKPTRRGCCLRRTCQRLIRRLSFPARSISKARNFRREEERQNLSSLIGAPYIDPDVYAEKLTELALPGVVFQKLAPFSRLFKSMRRSLAAACRFMLSIAIVFDPVFAGIAMVKVAHDLYPNEFRWKEPPYEYVFDKNPFDVICGTNKIREAIERGDDLDDDHKRMEDGRSPSLKKCERHISCIVKVNR